MKQCDNCRMQLDDRTVTCPYCGSTELSAFAPRSNPLIIEDKGAGNVVAGVVGAFLFSLIGGVLFFVLCQIGYIVGVCGLIIFVLANFGYHLFAKGEKDSVAGMVTAVIMSVVMILLAEYVSLSYEIYVAYREDFYITIFDAIRITPEFLADPDILAAVGKDLAFAYIFSLIGIGGSISNRRKAKKRAAQAKQEAAVEVEDL